MEYITGILRLSLHTLPFIFINPFFWLLLVLVFFQYRRVMIVEKKLFGEPKSNVWNQMLVSLGLGLLGGLFASILLIFLGIPLDRIGILYLWPIALLLFMVNPRYLCFAYAGGIVAIFALVGNFLFNIYPAISSISVVEGLLNIYLPGLMALIAILHLTESLLIYLNGYWGNSPIYLKISSGKVIGAYNLQRFWPLPLFGLMALFVPESSVVIQESINMPEWWPILGAVLSPPPGEELIYLIIPIIAGLGYSDVAISTSPRQKSALSAYYLALYSILLLSIALIAEYSSVFLLLGAFFAPLGHEYLIIKGMDQEFSRKPLFEAPAQGVKVLDIISGSPADKAGLKPGDHITAVNSREIQGNSNFWLVLQESYFMVNLELERDGRYLQVLLKRRSGSAKRQGIILVPDPSTPVYVELKKTSSGKKIWNKLSFWKKKN